MQLAHRGTVCSPLRTYTLTPPPYLLTMQLAHRSTVCSPLRTYTLMGDHKPAKYLVGPQGLSSLGGVLSANVHDAVLADDTPPQLMRGSDLRKAIRCACACACHFVGMRVCLSFRRHERVLLILCY